MRIKIKTQEATYFLKFLYILSSLPPFDKLRPKELELYAHLLTINNKYRNIPFKERNKLIFNSDTRINIANKMGIKVSGVYNILSSMKNLGIIEEGSLIPKYTLPKSDKLIFIFEEDD